MSTAAVDMECADSSALCFAAEQSGDKSPHSKSAALPSLFNVAALPPDVRKASGLPTNTSGIFSGYARLRRRTPNGRRRGPKCKALPHIRWLSRTTAHCSLQPTPLIAMRGVNRHSAKYKNAVRASPMQRRRKRRRSIKILPAVVTRQPRRRKSPPQIHCKQSSVGGSDSCDTSLLGDVNLLFLVH